MNTETRETLRFLQSENARLKEENNDLREENSRLHRVLDVLKTLQDLSWSISAETNVLGLLDRILQSALSAIDATAGSLILVDDDTQELVFTAVHGPSRERIVNFRLPRSTGIVGWVADHVEPVVIPNVRADPRFSATVDEQFDFRTHSLMCAPIATARKVVGVLTALNKAYTKEFTQDDLALLTIVAQLSAVAMERAESAVNDQ